MADTKELKPVAYMYERLKHDYMGGWESNITKFDPRESKWIKPEDLRDVEPLYSADALERLERERDEATANARMYEAIAKEAARGLECLSDIDDAWDAIGTRGNRKALTLAEQISSLAREMDDAESELDTLRARLAKMEEAIARLEIPTDAMRRAADKAYMSASKDDNVIDVVCMAFVRAALTEEQP